jgi:hypothetical protein
MSFSIDSTSFLSTAASIFNALFPAFAVIIGIGLGIGLLRYVVKAIQDAF